MPAREFINPNLHVILIHYPLGLLIAGTLIEVFSFLWPRSGFRTAGRWMIFLGALSAIPTAYAGLYALADVVRMNNATPEAMTWAETRAGSPLALTPAAWDLAVRHAWWNSGAVAAAVLAVIAYAAGGDRWRERAYVLLLILLLGGVGAMVVGAFYGGEMVYRHGTGVEEGHAVAMMAMQESPDVFAPPPAAEPAPATAAVEMPPPPGTSSDELIPAEELEPAPADPGMAETEPPGPHTAAEEQTDWEQGLQRYVPPLQTHVILAGAAVAMALGAWAATLRVANTLPPATVDSPESLHQLGAAFQARPNPQARAAANLYALDPLEADPLDAGPPMGALPHVHRPGIPAAAALSHLRLPTGRFWVLAALLGVFAAGAGWWVLASSMEMSLTRLDPGGLWMLVWDEPLEYPRRAAHVISAGAIIVLPLVLGLLARFAPRKRGLIFLTGLVLVSAVAAQTWFGLLLLWDSPMGTLWEFNP